MTFAAATVLATVAAVLFGAVEPCDGTPEVGGIPDVLVPGESYEFEVAGLVPSAEPSEPNAVDLYLDEVHLGSAQTDGDGIARTLVTLPEDWPAGTYPFSYGELVWYFDTRPEAYLYDTCSPQILIEVGGAASGREPGGPAPVVTAPVPASEAFSDPPDLRASVEVVPVPRAAPSDPGGSSAVGIGVFALVTIAVAGALSFVTRKRA